MTRRAATIYLTLAVLCALAAPVLPTLALAGPDLPTPALPENIHVTSQQALDLRKAGDLVPYTPQPTVLAALFTADEKAPKAIYGPVEAYVKTRACPTTWLMEKAALERVERRAAQKAAPPYEISLTLEEDCPGKVTQTVFITAPGSTPESWLGWRQLHGRKAGSPHSSTLAGLRKAVADGLILTAELQALSVNGVLVTTNLEDALITEGRLSPVFNLQTGVRTDK